MFDVTFIDTEGEPPQRPDPSFPNGRHINIATKFEKTCTKNLPYPSHRYGAYKVKCLTCGYIAVITVSGRADDPNIITMPCRATKGQDE